MRFICLKSKIGFLIVEKLSLIYSFTFGKQKIKIKNIRGYKIDSFS